MIKKKCNYCGLTFPIDYFHVAVTTRDKIYRRRKCRNCYRLTKLALIEKHYAWLSEYKQRVGCVQCGIKDPRVLDFHHKKGEDKLFTIGGFRREVGFGRLQTEIDKCEVVCANCHRIIHDEIKVKKNGA